jgi:anti-sigma regulatory factor (Ser/Thr protein kinase)
VVEVDHRDDVVVVRLRGCLSLREIPRIREAAVKSLLDTGRVLIDLSRLRCRQPALVSVFPSALAVAGGWPSARLVLFGATDQLHAMLVSVGVPETVSLAKDVSEARARLDQRPAQLRRHCDLPVHRAAPAAARQFVRQSCQLWSVSEGLEQRAELVASELVTNAVEHAQSSSRLTVTSTGSALRVSVRDYRPTPAPRPHPIALDAPAGRGLHLVTALAYCWGTDEHPDGKTIWAHLVDRKQDAETGRRLTHQTGQLANTPPADEPGC